MPPKLFLLPMFCTTGLVSSKEVAQMYEKETYFRKLLFKQSEMVLEHLTPLTITFGLVTPKSIGFQCYPRWMCRPSFRNVGPGVLELLIRNGFGTFDPGNFDLWPSSPKINRVHLLPRMDVCTKCKEGRARQSQVIYRKQEGYRLIYRPTCAKQYALSFSKGGHKDRTRTIDLITVSQKLQ